MSDISATLGRDILYRASSGIDRAEVQVDAERVLSLGAELIVENWDPQLVSMRNLPFLAWAQGVNLWDDAWAEDTKRRWVGNQFQFKALRGSIAAARMALGLWSYDLVDYLAPPQGLYASPDLTQEQWDEWIRLMPELRIYLGSEIGQAVEDDSFVDFGFLDDTAIGEYDAWALYGRKAIIRRNGVDTPVKVVQRVLTTETSDTVDIEEYHPPGLATAGIFVDDTALEEDAFLDFEELHADIVRVRLDRSYSHQVSELQLSIVIPNLEPLDVTYERTSDIGQAEPFAYADDGFAEWDFVERDDAALMLADRIYLNDPNVSAPMTEGISFLDLDRLGMPPRTIEMMVDLNAHEVADAGFVDAGFIDEAFIVADSILDDIDNACRAIEAAKALGDKVLVDFAVKRQFAIGDRIEPDSTIGEWVPNTL